MSGIIDFEIGFPSGTLSVDEIRAKSGLAEPDLLAITHTEKIPVLAEHEQAWELVADAARTILNRTGVAPERIGQVIYCGSGQWDAPLWSPSAKVANELGIRDAHCYEVVNFCNCTTIALRLASDEITLGRSAYVLVLIGDGLTRNIDYGDPDSRGLFNFGDAPTAILLGGERPPYEILHTAVRSDPTWCDFYFGDIEDEQVLVRRRDRRLGIGAAYLTNFTRLVGETLDALGREVDDIAYFLINHSDKAVHTRLIERIGIPRDKSVFNYDHLGHMGGGDPFIALDDLRGEERLKPGDLILLATSGVGFSWGVTALEYRPES